MEAILRVSRSRQHALTTALRVDMAYLCVGERTVFSLLLAPLFKVKLMVMASAIAWVSS